MYYLTGDEIADDAKFIGQRRITSFTISYRAVAPVNVIYRFYNNDLTAPITEEGRLQEHGLLVKEIREFNLPAGDHLRTINLPTAEQFIWGTPIDTEAAAIFGNMFYSTQYGGEGFFSVQFTDANGGNSETNAGSLLTRPAYYFAGFNVPELFSNYLSNALLYNVSQSDRTIFETEFYPLPPNSDPNQNLGLYLQVSGVNVTPPLPTPTPTPSPTPAANPTLAALSLSGGSVRFGTPVTGTVTLSAPATNGATVALSSSNTTAATVPPSVTIAPGATTATFRITTSTVQRNNSTVITATLGSSSRQASLQITRR